MTVGEFLLYVIERGISPDTEMYGRTFTDDDTTLYTLSEPSIDSDSKALILEVMEK